MEDTTIEDALKTVEALYREKDYASALQTLEVNKANISSGLWNYNMGTVYAGLKSWPLARYHLLKAEKEGFFSQELTQNLELVESNLEVSRLEKPTSTYDYFVKGAQIASQGILTSVALLILVVGLFNLRKEKNVKAIGALTLSVLTILALNWWIRLWPESIVTKSQMIQEGPSAIFAGREELPLGLLVITNTEGEWVQIKYPSRFQGWIKKEGLKELK